MHRDRDFTLMDWHANRNLRVQFSLLFYGFSLPVEINDKSGLMEIVVGADGIKVVADKTNLNKAGNCIVKHLLLPVQH